MSSEDRDQSTDVVTDDTGSRAPRSADKRKHLPLWQETILLLGIALLLAVVIKAVLVQAFYIPSESMEPGLVKNDRILVQKVSYWFGGGPERGDVVVFKDPGGWLNPAESAGPSNPVAQLMAKIGLYPQGGHLVKRVIGVEGDVIECCDKKGRVTVNGTPLDEGDFLRKQTRLDCDGPRVTECQQDWTVGPVPDGHLFVMGDNRENSADSSAHMCRPGAETDCSMNPYVAADLVVGKVFVLLWPADRFDWLDRPETFADVAAPE